MLKTLSIAVLNGYLVHGTIQQMEDALKSYFNDTGIFRGFTGFPGISDVRGYGCWCYFPENAEELYLGRGHPQDSIDTVCQKLSHGYECAYLETTEENGFTCEPWNQLYFSIWAMKSSKSPEEIWQNCVDNQEVFTTWSAEEKLCAARACSVEVNFLENYTDVLMSYNVDDSLNHENGFNVSETCIHVNVGGSTGGNGGTGNGGNGNGGGGGGGDKDDISGYQGDGGEVSDKECCGIYPNRFPYHPVSASGFRHCCVDKTYNDLVHVCCNGQIQPFCS